METRLDELLLHLKLTWCLVESPLAQLYITMISHDFLNPSDSNPTSVKLIISLIQWSGNITAWPTGRQYCQCFFGGNETCSGNSLSQPKASEESMLTPKVTLPAGTSIQISAFLCISISWALCLRSLPPGSLVLLKELADVSHCTKQPIEKLSPWLMRIIYLMQEDNVHGSCSWVDPEGVQGIHYGDAKTLKRFWTSGLRCYRVDRKPEWEHWWGSSFHIVPQTLEWRWGKSVYSNQRHM